MLASLKTKRYFTCPNGCAHQFIVEHLLTPGDPCAVTKAYPKRTAGPWYCDECGQGWRIAYDADSIEIEPISGEKKRFERVVIELPPQTEPVRFTVRGIRFTPEIDDDATRYYYEEHTCPTNWLRRVVEVSIGDDDDPHGLWHVVGVTEDETESP